MCSLSLQDLPDVQELITQVRSEKCSLQAAAILGEPPSCLGRDFFSHALHTTVLSLKSIVWLTLFEIAHFLASVAATLGRAV